MQIRNIKLLILVAHSTFDMPRVTLFLVNCFVFTPITVISSCTTFFLPVLLVISFSPTIPLCPISPISCHYANLYRTCLVFRVPAICDRQCLYCLACCWAKNHSPVHPPPTAAQNLTPYRQQPSTVSTSPSLHPLYSPFQLLKHTHTALIPIPPLQPISIPSVTLPPPFPSSPNSPSSSYGTKDLLTILLFLIFSSLRLSQPPYLFSPSFCVPPS